MGFAAARLYPSYDRRRRGACGQRRGRDEIRSSDLVACRPMTFVRSGSLREDPPGATPPPAPSETGRAAAAPRDGAADATAADDLRRGTPMMEQYVEIKAAHPDCLLFYRMGDFYELFFADAEVASRALGIVLTKRGRHLGRDIPMCGVPVERSEEYLHRLIALGHRV